MPSNKMQLQTGNGITRSLICFLGKKRFLRATRDPLLVKVSGRFAD
jgi:hypothetical protein